MIALKTSSFTVHAIDGYIETLYLVEYPTKLLLLDGGCRCDADVVVEYIATLGRSITELKLVVITHHHPDHSGAAPILQKQYGIPIAALPIINKWYVGLNGWLTQKTDIFLTYYVARKKKKRFKHLRFPRMINIDFPLTDGASIPLFEDWQLLCTPGHTTVDTSIYHCKESIAYVADLLIGFGTRYSMPYPISDPVHYRQSLSTIKELNLKHILLAHHGAHSIPSDIFDSIINQVSNRPKNHVNSIKYQLGLNR